MCDGVWGRREAEWGRCVEDVCVYNSCMKNGRGQLRREQGLRKTGSIERHTFSPTNRNAQTRLVEYQHLARKAKEQLRDLEGKRKTSPDPSKDKRTLPNSYSQKYFTKPPTDMKDVKVRSTHKDPPQQRDRMQLPERGTVRVGAQKETARVSTEGRSAEGRVSTRKKQFMDSSQYKKLHEKLDSIEHKITDMKRNLQRKKEEKQRILEGDKRVSLKGLVTQVPEQAELRTFNSNPYSPRHNVYYVSELIRAYQDEKSLAREHLVTSLNVLKLLERSKRCSEDECRKMRLTLPRKKGYEDRKTIVFDLDETLIHCNDSPHPPCSVRLPIKFPTGEVLEAGINVRPYARQILRSLSKHFEVVVFTASHSCYANVVVDYLDPDRQYVHHRLFREHCFLSAEGLYVKDLRMIDRDLSSMVLVDNAAYSYAYQLDNAVPIFPYYHGQVDFELKVLEEYLMKMLLVKDVREINQRTFKLQQYRHYYGKPEQLVQELYLNK